MNQLYQIIKRTLDFLLALLGLILSSFLFIIISILIKLDSKGPVFFRQTRIGKNEKIFEILKFRTMVEKAEKFPLSAMEIRKLEITDQDPRVTKIGHFLRRLALDELPQLINILKGDMSFVGPRPYCLVRMETNDLLKKRTAAKPGLTSLVVIKGGFCSSEKDILRYDLEYIEKQNFWLDAEIFIKTLWLLLSGKGFYGK